ncbi:MAG TPA: ABC transporter ATP-binding protein [Actinophytocola sp.]|jgi:oligopeptide/dipeptide ABC transporter ATP-binding protein|nr:ABC transporter ATP-binding protein [Actinophytocola sp.]
MDVSESDTGPLLSVRDLHTEIVTRQGIVQAVNGVSFDVARGESVGLVGESGSGKTMTCMSLMRLLPVRGARITSGEVRFDGVDLTRLPESAMRGYRGRRMALIMQDALTALNPVLPVGSQVAEPIRYHLGWARPKVRERVVDVMSSVRIPRPADRLGMFPHQFSGGTRQRIVAAMGMGAYPQLIIADEPTTALDVTTQAQFLSIIRELRDETGMSTIWVTHDLGIAAQVCDRINVMYAGRIVESGTVRRILKSPLHPYTSALMRSVPTLGVKRTRLPQIEGRPPDLRQLPAGCAFAPRCPLRMDICEREYPPATAVGDDGYVHCWDVARRSGESDAARPGQV